MSAPVLVPLKGINSLANVFEGPFVEPKLNFGGWIPIMEQDLFGQPELLVDLDVAAVLLVAGTLNEPDLLVGLAVRGGRRDGDMLHPHMRGLVFELAVSERGDQYHPRQVAFRLQYKSRVAKDPIIVSFGIIIPIFLELLRLDDEHEISNIDLCRLTVAACVRIIGLDR